MAHQLKYYKEIDSHGHLWRVEILQDTEDTLTPMEIGPVLQGLRLVVQGDQADVDTPIVKTSLEMTFVDAPDLEEERKCGYWEEFYTSSATEYQVKLYKDGQIEWTGYVTPDSFSENLRYRGSVTIIARDNLGALQDFTYNMSPSDNSGLITVLDIINKGLEMVSFPMEHIFSLEGARKTPYCAEATNATLFSSLYNNSAFYEKTWQEAIEEVLYATGLTMRYVGNNKFVVCSLRDIPLYDKEYWWDVPVLSTIFCATGNRELSPAAKSIREEVKFDISEDITDSKSFENAYGDETTYKYGNPFSSDPYIDMPIHAVNRGIFQGAGIDTTILLNAYKYAVIRQHSYGKGGEIHNPDIVYVCANLQAGNLVYATKRAVFSLDIPAGSYKIAFEVNKVVALYENNTAIGYADYNIEYWRFGYEAVFTGVDGTIKTLNNRSGSTTKEPEWQDGASNGYHSISGVELPKAIESPVLKTDVAGTLVIKLRPADISMNFSEISKGGYLGIANIAVKTLDNGGLPIMDVLRVKTEYNNKNNIVLSRTPSFAPNISDVISHRQIKNAIFVRDSDSAVISSDQWLYHDADIQQQLGVLIHQQILAYYSKPNNVLTGELATDNPLFNALYEWNGKKHLLTSGALNVITGRMENVVLREFMRYDHMWETWVENEDIKIDYAGKFVPIRVHSNASLSKASLSNLPSWLTYYGINKAGSVYTFTLTSMSNVTGQERSAIIKIDTAYARITQSAAGDYNIDYGTDYS